MAKKIFINLPVSDVQKAMAFYTAIGFVNNPQFTDETAACMVVSDEIYVMLLINSRFKEFTKKEIGNNHLTASVINSLSVDSLEEVNSIADKALKAGGKESNEPIDYGYMQHRSFEDLDGHLWEIVYMDMSKFPKK